LGAFIPLLLNGSSIFAERLELYRTQTLLPLLPVDQKLQKANAEMDRIIDSTMALNMDNIPIDDIPIVNSKAGLYVYLNSLVCFDLAHFYPC
jgi:mediator of RNA polymerase II transcription subunit 5